MDYGKTNRCLKIKSNHRIGEIGLYTRGKVIKWLDKASLPHNIPDPNKQVKNEQQSKTGISERNKTPV